MEKYKQGDLIGPYKMELISLQPTAKDGGHRYGLFKCSECNNVFKADVYRVNSGVIQRCPECRVKKKKGKNNFNFKDLINHRFGKLLVISYEGSKQVGKQSNGKILTRSLWKCKCDCGNIIYRTTNQLTRNNVFSCPKCNLKSRGEWVIKNIFDENNIKYNTQKRFDSCFRIKNHYFSFDFYLPEYNTCIQYDGISHYTLINMVIGIVMKPCQTNNREIKLKTIGVKIII